MKALPLPFRWKQVFCRSDVVMPTMGVLGHINGMTQPTCRVADQSFSGEGQSDLLFVRLSNSSAGKDRSFNFHRRTVVSQQQACPFLHPVLHCEQEE